MNEPVSSEPDSHAHYMRPLDGLRGFACLLVIICHIGLILQLNFAEHAYNIGGMGVVLFFSLSGFLMSMLYMDKIFSLENIAKYSIARATRIAPAYWLAILTACALYIIIPAFSYEMTPGMMARSFAFMSNQGVFWSISPEIQFYLFFLLLWFSYRKFKEGNPLFIIMTFILVTVFVATKDLWGGLLLPSKIHIFIGGFSAAFLIKNHRIRPVLCHVSSQIFITAFTAIYAVFILADENIYKDFIISMLAALSIASLSQSTIFTRPLEAPTMRLLGAASFSIYLFHEMILRAIESFGFFENTHAIAMVAIMCTSSLAIPVAFHFLAEKPLNKKAKTYLLDKFEHLRVKTPV